jgi:hypothetical protein
MRSYLRRLIEVDLPICGAVAGPRDESYPPEFPEEARTWKVESVEQDNRGFDLISRKPHPEDPKTAIEVRFIEVKGHAHTGEIALTTNEYNTAKRLRKDYWLYVVFQCATPTPSLNVLHDPATLDWQPIVKVEHYRLNVNSARSPVELREEPTPYRTQPD